MVDVHFDQGFTEALMNAVSDGVTVIDRDLRIIYQNKTIRRQFDLKARREELWLRDKFSGTLHTKSA